MADAADIVNGYEVKSGRRNRFVQHEGGRRIDQVWDFPVIRHGDRQRQLPPHLPPFLHQLVIDRTRRNPIFPQGWDAR